MAKIKKFFCQYLERNKFFLFLFILQNNAKKSEEHFVNMDNNVF